MRCDVRPQAKPGDLVRVMHPDNYPGTWDWMTDNVMGVEPARGDFNCLPKLCIFLGTTEGDDGRPFCAAILKGTIKGGKNGISTKPLMWLMTHQGDVHAFEFYSWDINVVVALDDCDDVRVDDLATTH